MAWLDPAFTARAIVAVLNLAATQLNDQHVRIQVDVQPGMRTDWGDVRFTGADGITPVPYVHEGEGSFVVEVDSIDEAKALYVYWGNPNATQPAPPAEPVIFSEDFTGDPLDKWEVVSGAPALSYGAPNGFTSQWYRNTATVDYYSGATGTFPSNNRPMATYANGRTYFVWADGANAIQIAFYDHTTQEFSASVQVGSLPDNNGHRNPSLLRMDDGHLYVFYGSHSSTTFVRRSLSPDDITAWATRASLTGGTTYPQPWELTQGVITVVYRAIDSSGHHIVMRQSSDGAATWEAERKVLKAPSGKRIYGITGASEGPFPRALHYIYDLYVDSTAQRRDFYHVSYDPVADAWSDGVGQIASLPVLADAVAQIHDSGTDQVQTQDLQVDSQGRARFLFSQGSGSNWAWGLLRQETDGTWTAGNIPATADHQFDHGALRLETDTDFTAYLPANHPSWPGEDGGEIEEWITPDAGVTWSKYATHTQGSQWTHGHVKAVRYGLYSLPAIWSYGDPRHASTGASGELWGLVEDDAHQLAPGAYEPILTITGTAAETIVRVKGLESEADAEVTARVRPIGANPDWSCIVSRITAGGNYYSGRPNHAAASKIYRRLNGNAALLSTGPARDLSGWHDWKMRVEGGTVTYFVDGEQLAQASDTTIPNGSTGFRLYASGIEVKGITVKRLGAAPTPVPGPDLRAGLLAETTENTP